MTHVSGADQRRAALHPSLERDRPSASSAPSNPSAPSDSGRAVRRTFSERMTGSIRSLLSNASRAPADAPAGDRAQSRPTPDPHGKAVGRSISNRFAGSFRALVPSADTARALTRSATSCFRPTAGPSESPPGAGFARLRGQPLADLPDLSDSPQASPDHGPNQELAKLHELQYVDGVKDVGMLLAAVDIAALPPPLPTHHDFMPAQELRQLYTERKQKAKEDQKEKAAQREKVLAKQEAMNLQQLAGGPSETRGNDSRRLGPVEAAALEPEPPVPLPEASARAESQESSPARSSSHSVVEIEGAPSGLSWWKP
ncbi:hypothetical protein M4R22_13765 [Acidovorax sp. GBBC 3334]|uniref:hypothetical protein n=1 Tax=Acidovorax sp. GBBC 3334 TaxID=2940496 RepID=UPI002302ADFC|nr:hypothetical protein [Acidovorax sp. GBBC 3334]MDA8455836.1 hypothetical protein [Acidovorax sp. GBBC 3334]